MRAHNLCYSTLLTPNQIDRLDAAEYEYAPMGHGSPAFVRKKVYRGLLPEILDELLSARKRAKKAMKDAKDPFVKAVMNGRQLALKVGGVAAGRVGDVAGDG